MNLKDLELLKKAQDRLDKAALEIKNDPLRPKYHFLPSAQWMNDPNGTVFYSGYYHVFYQHNPYGDSWDHMHWGHCRTKDFIHWERLPIALAPNPTYHNEAHCFSGGAMLSPKNGAMLMYTSVAKNNEERANCQIILKNEQEHKDIEDPLQFPRLQRLKKVIKIDDPKIPNIQHDWRDPFIFEKNARYFMIVGANIVIEKPNEKHIPTVLCFESINDRLEEWHYRGVLAHFSDYQFKCIECPNLLQLHTPSNKPYDVLLCSPFEPVRYFVGNFDVHSASFTIARAHNHGFIDRSMSFYATNEFVGDPNRTLIIAWIQDFPKGRGWDGCLSLPRELSLNEDLTIIQKPAQELMQLREHKIDLDFSSLEAVLVDALDLCFELFLEIKKGTHFTITNEQGYAFVTFEDNALKIGKTVVNLPSLLKQNTFHFFFDRSIIECFINNGVECMTNVLESLHQSRSIHIHVSSQNVKGIAWKMRPICYV